MNAFFAWALVAALALPPTWFKPGKNPETPEQYKGRVTVIAKAVTKQVNIEGVPLWSRGPLALAVLVAFHAETSFHVHVHSGKLNGDPYLSVNGRARCLGQIHKDDRMSYGEWRRLAGLGLAATERCAKKTVRKFRGAMSACTDGQWTEANVARAMRRYRKGNGCKPTEESRERAARWAGMMARHGHPPKQALARADSPPG